VRALPGTTAALLTTVAPVPDLLAALRLVHKVHLPLASSNWLQLGHSFLLEVFLLGVLVGIPLLFVGLLLLAFDGQAGFSQCLSSLMWTEYSSHLMHW